MTLMIVIAVCGVIALVLGFVMCSYSRINDWKDSLVDLVIGALLVLVGLALLVGDVLLLLFVHGLLERF